MAFEVRLARADEVLAVERVLDDGRRALATLEIPQWQGEYPNRIDAAADVEAGISYVAVDAAGRIAGTAAISFAGEPTYDAIDGAWLTASDSAHPSYAVIHRSATSAHAARTGAMAALLAEAERIARGRGVESIRIDTHERNVPMRSFVTRHGFTECGVITLPYNDADPLRIAYEKVLA